jgi:hypothetical protein
MRALVTLALLGPAVAGSVSVAGAATLFTPPLPGGGAGVYCQAVNVSTAPRTVTLTISDATSAFTINHTCSGLAGLATCTLAVPGAGTAPHFCRVDVDGGKKTVRASIVRLTSDSVPAVALAAE